VAQVTVNIAGRAYRMACDDGQESHLANLARIYDEKINDLRGAFGEIGDMRLHVMAAITLADDIVELRRRLEGVAADLAALREASDAEGGRLDALRASVAETVATSAERIERVAARLASGGPS
jgi:cell division protein ZapA